MHITTSDWMDDIPRDCRICINECNKYSSCNVADKCFEREGTDGLVTKLSTSIWSTSANSNYYTQDASLSAWGTTVTPTLGPYTGTKTGVSGY
jgi:hypothetical protein